MWDDVGTFFVGANTRMMFPDFSGITRDERDHSTK